MRVAVIEKWVAVADIGRCLHNYNAVLEITSSLNRSSIFRLKKTWLKVSKQVLEIFHMIFHNWGASGGSINWKVGGTIPGCLFIHLFIHNLIIGRRTKYPWARY